MLSISKDACQISLVSVLTTLWLQQALRYIDKSVDIRRIPKIKDKIRDIYVFYNKRLQGLQFYAWVQITLLHYDKDKIINQIFNMYYNVCYFLYGKIREYENIHLYKK